MRLFLFLACSMFALSPLSAQISIVTLGSFTENKGQVHDQNNVSKTDVLYSGTDGNVVYHLKQDGVSYQLSNVESWKNSDYPKNSGSIELGTNQVADITSIYRIDVKWLNCNQDAEISNGSMLPGVKNFYNAGCSLGVLGVRTFDEIRYHAIYPGIDLKWYQNDAHLKYDYNVKAGSDYSQIRLQFEGATSLSINESGELVIKTPLGEIIEQAPVVFQDGENPTAKWMMHNNIASFEIKDLNPNKDFIIDPAIRVWGTYFGGTASDPGNNVSVDLSNNIYLSGSTNSSTSIATGGAFQTFLAGMNDAYLAKFTDAGNLIWATYYGGSADDIPQFNAVDVLNNVTIVGYTQSLNLPVGGSFDPTANGGADGFVAHFSSAGTLLWGTYLGGSSADFAYGCSTDGAGNIYIVGSTASTDFPVAAGFDLTYNGGSYDCILTKLAGGGAMIWSTYYGGAGQDEAIGCATDLLNGVFITGYSSSVNLPIAGGFDATHNGTTDGFIGNFSAGGGLSWSSYFGGAADEQGRSCAIDISGNVIITGYTTSAGFPVMAAYDPSFNGGFDAYVMKCNPASGIIWSTFIGSGNTEIAFNIFVEPLIGSAYITGYTGSAGFPTTIGSHQTVYGGGTYDAFISKFDVSGALQWSTFYGSTGDDQGMGCTLDGASRVIASGATTSTSAMSTAGTYQLNNGGLFDAFIAQFSECEPVLATVSAQTNVTCNGGTDGSATVSATGGSTFSYAWAPSGESTATASALTAGTHTCTVTNECGNTTTTTVTISQPSAIVLTPASQSNISCNGGNNGAASVTPASGGTAVSGIVNNRAASDWSQINNVSSANYASGFSFEAWVKPSATWTTSDGVIFAFNTSTASNRFYLGYNTALQRFFYFDDFVGNRFQTGTSPRGNWYHVAWTISNSNTINLYVNGVNVLTITSGMTYNILPSDFASLGQEFDGIGITSQHFDGIIDEVRIWNVALTPAIATSNFSICPPLTSGHPFYSNLVAYYMMDEASGTQLNDLTANNRDGVRITGTTWAAPVEINYGCFASAPGGYTYNWTPGNPTGDGTTSVTGLTAGTWTCTVTDLIGCTASQTFNITAPAALVASPSSQTNISCNGGSNGAASINTPTGGAGGYTYNWTPGNPPGDGTVSVTGLAFGTWTCTVTDANSCVATQTFNITQPTALVANPLSQTNVSCFGGSNGDASVTVSGGTTAYSYNWTPGNPTGDGTASVTGLIAGTWTCTVTDANSCVTTRTFNITSPTAISVSAASQTNISCNGGSNGAASINTPTGGAGGYAYNWTPGNPPGDGTVSVTGLTATTWTCTVTDANSCVATQTFNITQPSAVVATISSQTNVTCNGNSNGAATVTPSGGTAGYTFSWAPVGGTAATATGLTANCYTVTVIDANGCTAAQTVCITQPIALSVTHTVTNVSCNAGSNGAATVSVMGGTPSYTYAWAPSGGTAATASGLAQGTYTCTITDGNGCTIAQSLVITEPTALTSTDSFTDITCFGSNDGSATVSPAGGTSPYTYMWSPSGGTGPSATGLGAGIYTCTITDGAGCILSPTFIINEPSAISPNQMQNNISCNGGPNGHMMVSPSGGTGAYTYSWAPIVNSTSVLNGTPAGFYTCTITDANGCTASATFNLTEPAVLSATTMQTNVLCNGATTGDAMVMPAGGVSPYTYAWSSGGTGATETGLGAGTYTCTVTDANGCSSVSTVTITQPSALAVSTTQTNVLCNGNATGDAMVVVSGGVSPYMYAWSSGGSAATETGLGAGTYTCTITDDNGCTSTATVTITEPSALSPSALETDLSCFGGSDGAIDITVTGGTMPYTYDWNSGMYTTEDLSGLSAGTYSIVVTDANGCTLTGTLAVVQPSQIAHNGVVTDATGCTTNDGVIDLTTLGGTGPYTFAWSNAATTEDISGLDGGLYNVTITDANNCTESATFSITEPGAPTVTYSEPMDTACGGSLPTPPFTLSGESPVGGTWTGPGVSGNTFDVSLANIGMNVIIYAYTDVNGCSGSATDSIYVDLCMDVTLNSGQTSTFILYPNPTSGTLNIITNRENATIVVTDALGQQVMSVVTSTTTTQVDLSGNANGMYFVRVEQNGIFTTQRVMIAK